LPGTSFSAPEVSGVAALIWAARPELKNYQVAEIIKQSAARDTTGGWTATIGCGRLDAAAALELATRHTSAGPACTSAGDEPPAWPAPVIAPTVTALAASGSRGATVSLPFRVGKASGEVRALIGVQNNGTPIAQLTRGFFPAQTRPGVPARLAGTQDPDQRHAPLLRRAPRPSRQQQCAQLRTHSPEVALLAAELSAAICKGSAKFRRIPRPRQQESPPGAVNTRDNEISGRTEDS
jgi:hypothetical protein